ncbi:MAG: hypothetical protein Q8Q40_11845 [Methylococcaceae bacterium]|nr:hypothetical protein [Methylococcaceae bacterium]MDP3904653.1 hypothetical protein [Methylococcaceae bacterium]
MLDNLTVTYLIINAQDMKMNTQGVELNEQRIVDLFSPLPRAYPVKF